MYFKSVPSFKFVKLTDTNSLTSELRNKEILSVGKRKMKQFLCIQIKQIIELEVFFKLICLCIYIFETKLI